ncbi:hypothetical protein [Pseudomonas sp.]|uniref:hypothetical protein n=1 Tax=Pseudomonas sp. TaxID=306 RepID=UPI003C72EA42
MGIMSDRQITVPSQYVDSVLAVIEQHLIELISIIEDEDEGNPARLEIDAFRGMAQQLGYDFKIVFNSSACFSISRYALQSKR